MDQSGSCTAQSMRSPGDVGTPSRSPHAQSSSCGFKYLMRNNSFCLSTGSLSPAAAVTSPGRRHGRILGKRVADELTCPICLEAYRLPTTISCGHTFCRYCIAQDNCSRQNVCPLCRLEFGKTLSINMVLHNIMTAIGIAAQPSSSAQSPDTESSSIFINKEWWSSKLHNKSIVPLSNLARSLVSELLHNYNDLLVNDLVSCVYDHIVSQNLWKESIHFTDCEGAESLAKSMKLFSSNVLDNGEHLKLWLEAYVRAKPSCIASNNILKASHPLFTLTVIPNESVKIERAEFKGTKIRAKLPWAGGRHHTNHIQLPHLSVSHFHFLIVENDASRKSIGTNPSSNDPITTGQILNTASLALIDCGSTAGTMIRLDGVWSLENNWVLHLAPQVELQVEILSEDETMQCYLHRCSASEDDTGEDEEENLQQLSVLVWEKHAKTLTQISVKDFLEGHSVTVEQMKDYILVPFVKLSLLETGVNNSGTDEWAQPTQWIIDTDIATLGHQDDITDTHTGQSKKKPKFIPVIIPGSHQMKNKTTDNKKSGDYCIIYFGLEDPDQLSNTIIGGHQTLQPSWKIQSISPNGIFRRLRPFKDSVPLAARSNVVRFGQCTVLIEARTAIDHTVIEAPLAADRSFNQLETASLNLPSSQSDVIVRNNRGRDIQQQQAQQSQQQPQQRPLSRGIAPRGSVGDYFNVTESRSRGIRGQSTGTTTASFQRPVRTPAATLTLPSAAALTLPQRNAGRSIGTAGESPSMRLVNSIYSRPIPRGLNCGVRSSPMVTSVGGGGLMSGLLNSLNATNSCTTNQQPQLITNRPDRNEPLTLRNTTANNGLRVTHPPGIVLSTGSSPSSIGRVRPSNNDSRGVISSYWFNNTSAGGRQTHQNSNNTAFTGPAFNITGTLY